ncbi:SDR family oxidoreductase [Acinetobacter pittii]|uniref:SDR family NAD(P)-dependent oxidoreductase n=1 Tax=Acinetobacter pittii TaxID=48296 RepID=UPI0032616EF8
MENNQNLASPVVMISGAASGIGKSTALAMAEQSNRLCLLDLNKQALEELKLQLQEKCEIITLCGDVTDATFIQSAVNEIEHKFGRLDYVLNNAGMTSVSKSITDLEFEEWHRVIDVNIHSVYYCLYYQIPLMLKSGGGSIVNISSVLGLIGIKNRAAYVTSKHAVTGMTKAAALDYAEENIRVNSVHPGYIQTPLIAHIDSEMLVAKHPVKRLGTAEEVTALVKFLWSDEAKFITGSQYVIDGGYSIQ